MYIFLVKVNFTTENAIFFRAPEMSFINIMRIYQCTYIIVNNFLQILYY